MAVDLRSVALERIHQIFDKGRIQYLEEISALSFIGHDPLAGTLSLHEVERLVRSFREAFSDLRCAALDIAVGSGEVACRWRATGTHLGPFMGFPPTGRAVSFDGITMMRFHRLRLAEAWTEYDALRLLGQIGMVPEAALLSRHWERIRAEAQRLTPD